LSYYHAPYLTNIEQLQRLGFKDTSVLQGLAAQGFISQSLEELAEKTRYKLILNTTSSDYPYVNIHNDKVEKNFSLTFRAGDNRDKAIHLITALCANANSILIFDLYFSDNWSDTKNFFEYILPKKKLNLLYANSHSKDHLNQENISAIKKIHPSWKVKKDSFNTFSNAHDRYLLIDNKIEIILSSGFQYLFSTNKDLTCLIRYKVS